MQARDLPDLFRRAIEKAEKAFLSRLVFFTNVVDREEGAVHSCWVMNCGKDSFCSIRPGTATHQNPHQENSKARIQFWAENQWWDPENLPPEKGHLVKKIGYQTSPGSKPRPSEEFDPVPVPIKDLVIEKWQIQVPSIVFFFLPDDSKDVYDRIKMLSDIEFGVNTQCLVQQSNKRMEQ